MPIPPRASRRTSWVIRAVDRRYRGLKVVPRRAITANVVVRIGDREHFNREDPPSMCRLLALQAVKDVTGALYRGLLVDHSARPRPELLCDEEGREIVV